MFCQIRIFLNELIWDRPLIRCSILMLPWQAVTNPSPAQNKRLQIPPRPKPESPVSRRGGIWNQLPQNSVLTNKKRNLRKPVSCTYHLFFLKNVNMPRVRLMRNSCRELVHLSLAQWPPHVFLITCANCIFSESSLPQLISLCRSTHATSKTGVYIHL